MVDRGDVVRTGSVLAVLESSLERTTVAIAEARAAQEFNPRGLKCKVHIR